MPKEAKRLGGHVRPARLPRAGRQRLPHRQQDHRRGRPSPPAATASPPPCRSRSRTPSSKAVDDQVMDKLDKKNRKVDHYVRAGGVVHRPGDRQGRRDVRRHRLHQAVRQQRDPPRLPGRLHLQAVRLRLGAGARSRDPGRPHGSPRTRSTTATTSAPSGLERRHRYAPENEDARTRTANHRRDGHGQVGQLGVRADGRRRRPGEGQADGGRPRPPGSSART